jgi:hypothetical protein
MTGTVRKATIEEARAVWEGMPKPSIRKVAKALEEQGLEIAPRTVAKWKASDWKGHTPKGQVAATAALEQLAPDMPGPNPGMAETTTAVEPAQIVGSLVAFNDMAIAHVTENVLRRASAALAVCADAIMKAPPEVIVAAAGDLSSLLKVVIDGTKTVSDVQMRVTDLRSQGATVVSPPQGGNPKALDGEILPPLGKDHPLADFMTAVSEKEAHA